MTVRRMRKDRKELGIVERPAIDVGKDLDPARPQRDGAVDLFERSLDIVER